MFPPQAELLANGFPDASPHWLINAPTGGGKTKIAEEALLYAAAEGRIGVYLAPLRAILAERAADWIERLPELRPLLLSADIRSGKVNPVNDQRLILTTPEKFNSLLLRWKQHQPWIARVGCLVIDELHTSGDPGRGATLEALVGRFQRLNPFARIVGLTGTLSNDTELAHWMHATGYSTNWRPVPLKRSIRRFKKPTGKNDLLLAELSPVLESGGRALVFVNSRRRAETLAGFLIHQGVAAGHLHAGLATEEKNAASTALLAGDLQVIVATSSLEMGVNLPVRLVVIFDSHCFDGEVFGPMPVQRYLQMSGRAGRAGLDTTGDSILLLPVWSGDGTVYENADLPPLRSALFSGKRRQQEVLLEVASRLSISRRHLQTNFAARTLWHAQGGNASLDEVVASLVDLGLLKTVVKDDGVEFLTETPLGRIALQMAAPPVTVASWRNFHAGESPWSSFDLLLQACLMEEVTPRPGFKFEEIDVMGDLILSLPSVLLDLPCGEVVTLAGGTKRLLSAVKAAVILQRRTEGEDANTLAELFDAYAPDIRTLAENVEWTLETAGRVFAHLSRKEWLDNRGEDDSSRRSRTPLERLCSDLRAMVRHGVPRDVLTLVEVPGIGTKRALALKESGIRTLDDLLGVTPPTLATILRLKEPTVMKILSAVEELLATRDMVDPFSSEYPSDENTTLPPDLTPPPSVWPLGVDPYRLRRALDLQIDFLGAEVVRVSGGTEPHSVSIRQDARGRRDYTCDCADFAKGTLRCKHSLRAQLEHHDAPDLLDALRVLKPDATRPLRYSLGELWMQAGGIYDAFEGRSPDYSGS
ncbi:MAG: DEAD/DEAH box helicase, partial [Verrucomicrobiota bacterium]